MIKPTRDAVSDRDPGRMLEAAVVDSMRAGFAFSRTAQPDATPVIEDAKGILVAQHGCDPDEAFDLLRRASQRFNVPVRVLAARLAHGAQGPGPQAAQVFHKALRDSRAAPTPGALLDGVLDFALTLLHAERGNVQLADPAAGTLKIVAQRGFGQEFVEYFAAVTDDRSACGRAAQQHAQVVITDVTTDPGFTPHREIALASGFRAVQSTPLVNRAGHLVGIISTHYPQPTTPPRRDLQIISRFGALVGESLSTLLNGARTDSFPP
jgi:ANTAR domain/GAF domain